MKKKILVVDDDIQLMNVTRKILEATGKYEVQGEDSGRRALATAATFKPDLVILDIMMPDMDGGEVAGLLRKRAGTPTTTILFLSSLISKEEQSSPHRRVARDIYLAKPLDPQELCQRVAELLD